jgi:hypothetical protein
MIETERGAEPPLFSKFPKLRPPLPQAYVAIHEQEYLANRTRGSLANRLARWLENWMHRRVRDARTGPQEELLELGAGSLNHLPWERGYRAYDIVEPFRGLLEASTNLKLVRNAYARLDEVPEERKYDRILSVAVLEHMVDLPLEIALAGLRLREQGVFCAGIPSEGGRMWEWAWRYGTGTAYRRRTGLDYEVVMRHEHVNSAPEIEACVRAFFREVTIARFPLPALSLSLYTFIRATGADTEACRRFIESRARNADPRG